jgi:hypothetical protein
VVSADLFGERKSRLRATIRKRVGDGDPSQIGD